MTGDLAQKIGADHPAIQGLMGIPKSAGLPAYRRGTPFHMGGPAIVGEDGPEIVNMPRGSQVIPNPLTLAYDDPENLTEPFVHPSQREGHMEPPEPSDYLRQEFGDDEMFRRYQQMDRQQRLDFMNDPKNGFTAPPPNDFNPIEADNRFLDDQSYQVAQAGDGAFQPMIDGKPLDLNVTQAQRSGQAMRLLQAEATLRELEEKQGPRVGQRMLEMLPDGLENMLVDEDYGKFQMARDAFAEAAMRADTGATINESEWPRILKNLMARPGDSPERIAQRRAMRETIIRSLMMASGEAAGMMPQIGQPVVPTEQPKDMSQMSDEDILRALQGGN
jgi:hypothetical protein